MNTFNCALLFITVIILCILLYRIGNGRNKLFVFVFVFESADHQLAGQILCNYGPPPLSIPAYLQWGGRGSLPHTPAHDNTTTHNTAASNLMYIKLSMHQFFYMELILYGFETRSHFRDQKSLDFQGPPPPMPLVMDLAHLKTISYRAIVGRQKLAIVR